MPTIIPESDIDFTCSEPWRKFYLDRSTRSRRCSLQIPLDQLLDELCSIPKQCATHEQWVRYHHYDVPEMTPSERRLEMDAVKMRLLIDPSPSDWLTERYTECLRFHDVSNATAHR